MGREGRGRGTGKTIGKENRSDLIGFFWQISCSRERGKIEGVPEKQAFRLATLLPPPSPPPQAYSRTNFAWKLTNGRALNVCQFWSRKDVLSASLCCKNFAEDWNTHPSPLVSRVGKCPSLPHTRNVRVSWDTSRTIQFAMTSKCSVQGLHRWRAVVSRTLDRGRIGGVSESTRATSEHSPTKVRNSRCC